MQKKIEEAFNEQLNAEFYSSYLYLSMANYFSAKNLDGMANWMVIQAEEERNHAMKFVRYINDRDGRVILEQIEKPKTDWDSPLEAFRDALEHEQLISKKIFALVDLAIKENEHPANTFLQWFVSEQVEEEATVSAIVGRLELAGRDGMGLLLMDQELGQRTATPATPAAE